MEPRATSTSGTMHSGWLYQFAKAGVVENSSHRKIIPTRSSYGLGLRLRIGLNLGLGLEVGLRLGLGLGIWLRLGLGLTLVTLRQHGGGKNFPGATNFPRHRPCRLELISRPLSPSPMHVRNSPIIDQFASWEESLVKCGRQANSDAF